MTHPHFLKFQINKLLQEKMILITESIAIFIFALFVAVFLPQLLFQFVFASQELTAEPPLLRYIPVASFAVAVLYFVYASVLVIMKKMKIMQLEKELSMLMTDDHCDCMCACGECKMGDHTHHEMDSMEDDDMASAMSAPKKKPASKKKVAKKA